MIFIGCDFSLANSGICFLNETEKPINLFSIKTKRYGDNIEERFKRYFEILDELKKHSNYLNVNDVKIICIESYSLYSKGKIINLCESGTLNREYFLKSFPEAKIIEVAPISLKKFILGHVKSKGKEAKNIMCREVYKKYHLNIDDDNQVDAFILAKIAQLYYLYTIEKKQPVHIYQKEVLDSLIKKNKEKL